MASLSLIFDILARDRASKEINNVGDALDKAGKKGTLFGSAVGKGLAVAAGAFAGAGLVAGLKDFYDAAAESAKIGRLTEQVIKSTGGAAKLSAGQVGDLVTAISNKTGVDDEAIQSGANLLLTFTNIKNAAGKGNDVFTQTTQIMTDMSAALGTDASASAIQLGKALNDPVKGVTALTKVGVSFTKQQKDQIAALVKSGNVLSAQKVILAELGKEFGGAAAAASTPLDKLKVNLGNLQEQIGSYLIPIVDKAASFLLDKFLPAFSNVAGYVSDKFGPALSGAVDAVSGVFDKAVGAAKRLGPDIKKAFGSVKTAVSGALDGVTIDVSGIGSGIVDQVQKFGQPIIDGLKKGLADGDYTQAGEAAGQALTAAIRGAATAAKNITEAIGELIDKVNWGELALRFGKQAPTLVLGFVTGVLNFDIGSVLKFLGSHWVEVIFAILAVAFAPAKIVGKVAEILARIPLIGPFLEWGLRAFKSFSDRVVGFLGEMFGRFGNGFFRGGTGLIARFVDILETIYLKVLEFEKNVLTFWRELPGKIVKVLGDGLEALGRYIRDSFDALWNASKTIALLALGAIAVGFLNLVSTIINGAADAFGWVPGLGDKLKDAAKHFDDFRDNVNQSLLGLKDKDIEIRAKLSAGEVLSAAYKPGGSVYNSQVPAQARAIGGAIYGAGTGTSDSIPALLSNGEHVWTAQEVKKAGGQQAMYAMRAAVRRFATGGGVSVTATTDSASGIAAMGKWYDGLVSKVTTAGQKRADSAASVAYSGAVPTGPAVTRWAPLVSQVLAELGLNGGLVGKVLAQIKTESGGNPNATQGNIGDVNNRSGDLARGLMQVIGATFRAYAGPYRSLGQYDPHASIYAGLNYAAHRYGPNLSALGQGHGYARGGQVLGSYEIGTDWVPKTGIYQLHKGEAVVPAREVAGGARRLHPADIDLLARSIAQYNAPATGAHVAASLNSAAAGAVQTRRAAVRS